MTTALRDEEGEGRFGGLTDAVLGPEDRVDVDVAAIRGERTRRAQAGPRPRALGAALLTRREAMLARMVGTSRTCSVAACAARSGSRDRSASTTAACEPTTFLAK